MPGAEKFYDKRFVLFSSQVTSDGEMYGIYFHTFWRNVPGKRPQPPILVARVPKDKLRWWLGVASGREIEDYLWNKIQEHGLKVLYGTQCLINFTTDKDKHKRWQIDNVKFIEQPDKKLEVPICRAAKIPYTIDIEYLYREGDVKDEVRINILRPQAENTVPFKKPITSGRTDTGTEIRGAPGDAI